MARYAADHAVFTREEGDHEIGFAEGPGAEDDGFGLVGGWHGSADVSDVRRVIAQYLVNGKECEIFCYCLSNERSIERITVQQWQFAENERMCRDNMQLLHTILQKTTPHRRKIDGELQLSSFLLYGHFNKTSRADMRGSTRGRK